MGSAISSSLTLCFYVFTDDPCFPNPCRKGGNCFRDDGLKDFICNCTLGFIGKRCEKKIGRFVQDALVPHRGVNYPLVPQLAVTIKLTGVTPVWSLL